MTDYNELIKICKKFGSFSTALYAPLALFFLVSLIRNLINKLIFPTVPREGPLFLIQLWVNNLFMIFLIGAVGFTILLVSQLFRQYMMSPPFEISRHSGLEELNEGVTNRVFYRATFPVIIVLIGAVIPPVFGGWGYYVGGTILSVDKSDIAELSDTNSELILSVLPNIGGNIQFFNGVPSEEGKVLFVILSGLTVVSMWNLSYLSQIIFSPGIRIDTGNYIQNKFMERVIYTVIAIYFLSVLVEIL